MRIIIFTFLLLPVLSFGLPSKFVHPLEFDGGHDQTEKVLVYIQDDILENHCGPGDESCHSSIIIIEREENFNAFMALTKVTNRDYLDKLIQEYCNSEFFKCTYANILKAYEENLWCDKGLIGIRKKDPYSRYSEIKP